MSLNTTNSYKIIAISLAMLLLIFLFKSYKDNETTRELQQSLKQEITLTQSQLAEVIDKYDSVTMLCSNYEKSFLKLQEKVNYLKGGGLSLNSNSFDILSSRIDFIKDSLLILQKKIVKTNTEQNEILQAVQKNEVLNVIDNEKLTSKFEITNFQVKGVKFLSDKTSLSKAKLIEQIRVCFTIAKNDGISYGDKQVFVQVISPRNEIVSVDNLEYQMDETVLKYSKLISFKYEKQITDVCSYVNLIKNKTIKGRYVINLYSGSTKIGSTIFNYN